MRYIIFILTVVAMTLWQVIIPEATTNIISNPSFEANTTGWTAVAGGILTRDTTEQAVGLYSGKYVPAANTGDGVYFAVTLVATTNYTFGVSVFGVNNIPYQIYIYDATAPVILGTVVDFIGDGTWKRHVVTAKTGANTSHRVYVIKDGSADTTAFYVDAAQLEAKSYPTTYCDGDQPGCIWVAGIGTSTSIRDAQSTAGGRVEDLGREKYPRIRYGLGVGTPPVEIISTSPGQGDGGDYQTSIFKPRQFQLVGMIEGKGGTNILARKDYHHKRKNLIQAFNPHGVSPKQPRGLRHRVDGNSVEIRANYETGLQRQKAPLKFNTEAFSLGLKAEDPFWRAAMGVVNEDNGAMGIQGQGALSLTVQQAVANADFILEKDSDGAWGAMGTGLAVPTISGVTFFTKITNSKFDGLLYVCGVFTFTPRGGGTVQDLATWDGAVWGTVGGLTAANVVWDFVFNDSNGDLYIAGTFTTITGPTVAANSVAKWDGSSWTALGTGITGGAADVRAIAIDSSSNIYVGGSFTTAGGGGAANIAMWNGAAWSALTTGTNGVVRGLAVDSNDNLYVVGDFTTAGGVTVNNIAMWDGAAWSHLDNGVDTPDLGRSVDIDANDNVYFGGRFTDINAITMNNIAKWDGADWTALGTGTSDTVQEVNILEEELYIGGDFNTANGVTVNRIAKWTGTTFQAFDTGISTAGGDTVSSTGIDNIGMVYIGGLFTTPFAGISKWDGNSWKSIHRPMRDILQATDGKIYVAGGFINAGGVANGDYIAYWNPSTEAWVALGTGADGPALAIAEAPNGDIYIGGAFTLVGGVANTTGIAFWDVSGSVWTALSTGTTGTVFSLAFSPDGDLYIGGLFEDLGGVADTQNLAKWDGSAFVALSAEPNNAVNTLVFDQAGKLWLGGAFTTINATTYDYIAKYDPDTDTFSVLEVGTNGFVNDMDFGPDGNLYLVGTFTQAGSVSANRIAYWNGTKFIPLGTGFNNVGYAVDIDSDGQVFAGGAFTTAGGVTLPDKVAKWTGSVWVSLDVDLPGSAAIEAILVTNTGMFLGFDTSGSAAAIGTDTASYQGDAHGFPVITVIGPGQLYQLSNVTDGKDIYFDILLEAGETVVLDLRPGVKTFTSTFRGSVDDLILEGSDLESFILLPGDNIISLFNGDNTATAFMLWNERFQSFDGVVYLPIVN